MEEIRLWYSIVSGARQAHWPPDGDWVRVVNAAPRNGLLCFNLADNPGVFTAISLEILNGFDSRPYVEK